MTDTLAARASSDAFRYRPLGAESNRSGSSGARRTLSIHWLRSEKSWPDAAAGRGAARLDRGLGVQPFEVRAPKRPEPLEVDHAHSGIGGELRGELQNLLGRSLRDSRGGDNGKRPRLGACRAPRLEDGLRKERNESVTAAFGRHLQPDCIHRPAAPGHQVGTGAHRDEARAGRSSRPSRTLPPAAPAPAAPV